LWSVYDDFRRNGEGRREMDVPLKWGNYPVEGVIFVPKNAYNLPWFILEKELVVFQVVFDTAL
jgi:hypothetical protein